MRETFSRSNLTDMARAEAYNFCTPASVEIYRELMSVAQEIETCRASV